MVQEEGPLLEVKKLEVLYHRVIMAIQGISFRVPRGSIVALLGINGAGKTTTLRAISGFMGLDDAQISDGVVEMDGRRLNGKPPHEVARRGVILVPERDKVFATMTVEENLLAVSARHGADGACSIRQVYDYFPVLYERRRQVAGYLSGGERQMLAIGEALLCQPRLLLVDELSLGLAPTIVSHLMETLLALKQELGIALLVVEQNALAALKIADYCYIMENGRIVFEGTPERLLGHEDVQEFYLGLSEKGLKSYREVRQYRRTRRWWG